jgi:hypothetical protein
VTTVPCCPSEGSTEDIEAIGWYVKDEGKELTIAPVSEWRITMHEVDDKLQLLCSETPAVRIILRSSTIWISLT